MFRFVTIFSGSYNEEYRNLFNRRLPGNILLSAYYTPMTIRELSVELGVASAYLEDEIELLEKYKLMIALPGGKYQTKLVIYTESYTEDFRTRAVPLCSETLTLVYTNLRRKLTSIRNIGFIGCKLEENRLLWNLTHILLHSGHDLYKAQQKGGESEADEIYGGAYGINYGVDYDEYSGEYSCCSFTGYSGIDDHYAAAYADFGILPQVRWYSKYQISSNEVAEAAAKPEISPYVILSKAQRQIIIEIIKPELEIMSALYDRFSKVATETMCQHAPKSVYNIIGKVTENNLYFRTIGIIGGCIVKSGALPLPDFDAPAAMYIYRTDDNDIEFSKHGRMVGNKQGHGI